jgi:hypothetical protein
MVREGQPPEKPNSNTCRVCGRVTPWEKLKFLGFQWSEEDGVRYRLELRNCTCGATLGREEVVP